MRNIPVYHVPCLMILTIRIDLQDKIRRLGANPYPNDEQVIQSKLQALASMLGKAKQLQDVAGIVPVASGIEPFVENEGEFDEVGESASASACPIGEAHQNTQGRDVTGIERTLLILPSNGNVIGEAVDVEIRHRTQQAHRQINRLRETIAEISFQYSHVIRDTIRRSVRATAQKRIKALHNNLVLQARIYSRCRGRLIALKCDPNLLKIFRVLTRSDLKASSAVLQPNIPGSTSIQLSWIWQTGRWHLFGPGADADADADHATLLECLCISYFYISILMSP